MTGQPLALATALLSIVETTPTPETDLRASRTRALCILPTKLVAGSDTVSLPRIDRPTDTETRQDRVTAWLDGTTPAQTAETTADSDTHPSIDDRVERLVYIAASLEETV